MHLTKFCNHKNEKNNTWKFVNENISTVPKALFFKITDRYVVYLFSKYEDNSIIINLG